MRRLLISLLLVVAALPAAALATTNAPFPDRAQYYVRLAIPSIEAYYADEGTYVGMTVAKLRGRYDAGVKNISIRRATKSGFCIQSTADGLTVHYEGPSGEVRTGPCGSRGSVVPRYPGATPASSAQANVRGAVIAVELYYTLHGTYVGVTVAKLRQLDAGVTGISIARATADRYCIQSTVGSETYHYAGPGGSVAPGPCS